jgi:hypothetical protein
MKALTGGFLAVALLAISGVFSSKALAGDDEATETFTIDVAQDIKTNAQNNVNGSTGSDIFARGDTGIIDGTIYPGGTIPMGQPKNDPKAPGGIGRYTWVGTYATDTAGFLKAVARILGAPPVLASATEEFYLPDDKSAILTGGAWPNAFFTVQRPVLGGTGRFRYMVGETRELNIGENSSGGCNLRITFLLRKAKGDH